VDDGVVGALVEAQAGIAYPPANPKSLIQLLNETRANETIRTAPRWEDFGNDNAVAHLVPKILPAWSGADSLVGACLIE
jgi:hypothetical protein